MKKVTLCGVEIEYYDAIEDLPIRRYHKYNKMLLVDAGIGGDLFDVDGHIERAIRFAYTNDTESVVKELANLRNNLRMIQTEVTPRLRAFAALVTKINGVVYDDVSDDGITAIIEALQGVSARDVTATLEAVKKKITDELRAYFPKMLDSPETKEYYDILKGRALAVLRTIQGEDADVEGYNTRVMTYSKPLQFDAEKNAEIDSDKNFEVMCHVITENTGSNAKELSVLEYFTAQEYTKDKIKARENAYKRK